MKSNQRKQNQLSTQQGWLRLCLFVLLLSVGQLMAWSPRLQAQSDEVADRSATATAVKATIEAELSATPKPTHTPVLDITATIEAEAAKMYAAVEATLTAMAPTITPTPTETSTATATPDQTATKAALAEEMAVAVEATLEMMVPTPAPTANQKATAAAIEREIDVAVKATLTALAPAAETRLQSAVNATVEALKPTATPTPTETPKPTPDFSAVIQDYRDSEQVALKEPESETFGELLLFYASGEALAEIEAQRQQLSQTEQYQIQKIEPLSELEGITLDEEAMGVMVRERRHIQTFAWSEEGDVLMAEERFEVTVIYGLRFEDYQWKVDQVRLRERVDVES